jgi:hypothetical protein
VCTAHGAPSCLDSGQHLALKYGVRHWRNNAVLLEKSLPVPCGEQRGQQHSLAKPRSLKTVTGFQQHKHGTRGHLEEGVARDGGGI